MSRYWADANLYAAPARRSHVGRPRLKGRKLSSPQVVVQRRRRTPATVDWYGGGQRRVQFVSDTALWYKGGQGLVPVRWVFVHDVQGTHRDDYFYTTEPSLKPTQIISWFTARWPIETTFQEMRAHLGFETTRQHVKASVLRTAPCLLGLFSMICLIFAEHARRHRIAVRRTAWYSKTEPTFSDAIATVRRLFWEETVFEKASCHKGFTKLPPKLRNMLLDYLSQAA